MFKKKLKHDKQFKKGQSGNPKGRPRVKGALKDIKTIIGDELEKFINELLHMDLSALKKIAEDKTGKYTSFKQVIASIIYKSASHGDPMRLEALLNRVIGKVKDQVEISGDKENPIRVETLNKAFYNILKDESKE